MGKTKVFHLNEAGRSKIGKIITGSVQKFGSSNLITVRAVDVETSRVLFIISEKTDESSAADVSGRSQFNSRLFSRADLCPIFLEDSASNAPGATFTTFVKGANS